MTHIGASIAAWLQTGVGPVRGATAAEAIANAYEMWPGNKSFTQEQFRHHLELVGYKPISRSNGFTLMLPEHFGRK